MKIKSVLSYLVIGGLLVVPFVSFIVPDTMYFPFISGKGFVFRILIEILFGIYAILAFLDPYYRPKMSWITKSFGIFSIIILLADLFGANPYKSFWSNYERMEGFILIIHLFAYYIIASSVLKTKVKWDLFWNSSIMSSIIMSFYGLLQITGKIQINQGGVRADGTFGNASYLAIFLVFNIFLCIYMFLGNRDSSWKKWFYGLTSVFELFILYYTATRGAILGFLGGLVLTGLIMIFKEKQNLKLKKYSYIGLGIIVILIGGFISIKNTSFVQKSPVLSRFSTLSFSEIKTQGRYFVWPMAVKGFIEKPILGWGQENFNFVFNKYYDPKMYGQEQWFDRTHNIILDWLIAGGLLGFLSYASLYFFLIYYIWKKQNVLTLGEKSIVTGMISAYIFHNMFVFDNLLSYIMFFSVLAFVHSISVFENNPSGKFYQKTFSDKSVKFAIAPIVTILVICGVYYINVPAIHANFGIIEAMTPQQQGGVDKNLELFKKVYSYNSFGNSEALEQLVQVAVQISRTQSVPDSMKEQFYNFAKEKIEEKLKQTPNDARYLVFAGNFYNQFGQYDIAIPYLQKALENSPNKQTIYFELGTSYLGKGDKQKMYEIFKKAYSLEPNSPESRIIYAVGAIYMKDSETLKQLSSVISQDTVVNDNRFLRAFADIGDYQSVINILNERLKKDPTNAQYKLSLASTYATIGQKQKAVDLINEIIKDNPQFKDQGEMYIKQIWSN